MSILSLGARLMPVLLLLPCRAFASSLRCCLISCPLYCGRMIAMAGMVGQELATGAKLF